MPDPLAAVLISVYAPRGFRVPDLPQVTVHVSPVIPEPGRDILPRPGRTDRPPPRQPERHPPRHDKPPEPDEERLRRIYRGDLDIVSFQDTPLDPDEEGLRRIYEGALDIVSFQHVEHMLEAHVQEIALARAEAVAVQPRGLGVVIQTASFLSPEAISVVTALGRQAQATEVPLYVPRLR